MEVQTEAKEEVEGLHRRGHMVSGIRDTNGNGRLETTNPELGKAIDEKEVIVMFCKNYDQCLAIWFKKMEGIITFRIPFETMTERQKSETK